MEIPFENQIYLVFGLSEKITNEIVKYLLKNGKKVRVVLEDKSQLKLDFHENQLESIIESDIVKENPKKIEKYFTPNQGSNVKFIISAIGHEKSLKNSEDSLKITKKIIETLFSLGILPEIERYVILTNSGVNKPFSFNSIYYNLFYHKHYHYQYLSEQLIKKSGVNYLIIRHTNVHYGDEATEFTIDQKPLTGEITAKTVANITVDALLDQWIYPNSTIETSSTLKQRGKPYNYQKGRYLVKKDNKDLEKVVDHLPVMKIGKVLISTLSLISIGGLFSLYIHYFKQKEVKIYLK